MAETRSRREPNGPRTRPAGEDATEPTADAGQVEEAAAPAEAVTAPPVAEADLPPGFDPEVNSRYEEIKRGGTYITELQQMTMAQLLKSAKDDGLPKEDYAGLKKQDLIFRIVKERVKQNG